MLKKIDECFTLYCETISQNSVVVAGTRYNLPEDVVVKEFEKLDKDETVSWSKYLSLTINALQNLTIRHQCCLKHLYETVREDRNKAYWKKIHERKRLKKQRQQKRKEEMMKLEKFWFAGIINPGPIIAPEDKDYVIEDVETETPVEISDVTIEEYFELIMKKDVLFRF